MKISAGILVYRKNNKNKKIEVLLGHPGGPYWKNKDKNSWSIPKGQIEEGSRLETAVREFEEETGLKLTEKDKKAISYLGKVINVRKDKIVYVFLLEKDFGDKLEGKSNLTKMEWPPDSGKIIEFPEIDKIKYFDLKTAKKKLVKYQKLIIDLFLEKLK
jgi:predicted NUDIX family NTP pyrophosphohydrolase